MARQENPFAKGVFQRYVEAPSCNFYLCRGWMSRRDSIACPLNESSSRYSIAPCQEFASIIYIMPSLHPVSLSFLKVHRTALSLHFSSRLKVLSFVQPCVLRVICSLPGWQALHLLSQYPKMVQQLLLQDLMGLQLYHILQHVPKSVQIRTL